MRLELERGRQFDRLAQQHGLDQRDLALRAPLQTATSPPRSPTAAASHRRGEADVRARAGDGRTTSGSGRETPPPRSWRWRFSRRSSVSSCLTVVLYFSSFSRFSLAVEVGLDRRLADALGQFADRRADVDVRQRFADGDSSPWPISVTAASRRSRASAPSRRSARTAFGPGGRLRSPRPWSDACRPRASGGRPARDMQRQLVQVASPASVSQSSSK